MKNYVGIIVLGLVLLMSLNLYASEPISDTPCQKLALAMASETAAGEATSVGLLHSAEVEKDTFDYTYSVEVIGGQGGPVQNIAVTVRFFSKDGVGYCG